MTEPMTSHDASSPAMSLREKIARMIAAWTYSGPPWLDKDWEVAANRADQILAAIEAERLDVQTVVAYHSGFEAGKIAERERLAKAAEEIDAFIEVFDEEVTSVDEITVADWIRSRG